MKSTPDVSSKNGPRASLGLRRSAVVHGKVRKGLKVRHELRKDFYDFNDIFAEKFGKKLAFFTQNKANLCKILIITLVCEKNANFVATSCQKLQKIMIITSTPDKLGRLTNKTFFNMPMYIEYSVTQKT
jgi:hypothetical protein